MRLLIIGDIVGRPGKHACSQIIPRLIGERGIDCVIANAENAAAPFPTDTNRSNRARSSASSRTTYRLLALFTTILHDRNLVILTTSRYQSPPQPQKSSVMGY